MAQSNEMQQERHILHIDIKELSSLISVASTVLSEEVHYETLEITCVIKNDIEFAAVAENDKDIINSNLCQKLWQKLGETVTEVNLINIYFYFRYYRTHKLDVLALRLKSIMDHLIRLKKLTLNTRNLQIPSFVFSMQINKIEVIEIKGPPSPGDRSCIYEMESEDGSKYLKVQPELENFIKFFTSIKTVSLPCKLPYRLASLTEPLASFCCNCLHTNKTVFEWDMPSDSNFKIHTIEIEIVEEKDFSKKSIVKAVIILFIEQPVVPAERFCIFDHKILSNKALRGIMLPDDMDKICLQCVEFMFKSFTNPKCWKPPFHFLFKSNVLLLMSENLPYISHLSVVYSECLESFPNFSQLTSLSLHIIHKSSVGTFGLCHLSECCPNLEELSIIFDMVDIHKIRKLIVDGIFKKLRKLNILDIDERVKIDSVGLKAIAMNLKQLRRLKFSCDEDSHELIELLKQLPHLDLIECQTRTIRRTLTRQLLNAVKPIDEINSRDALETLPEELWALVFEKLTHWDQVICRRVCKRWWNIFNSFPNFLRILSLPNCVLSSDTNPVKTFTKTNFHYNSLELIGPLIVCEGNVNEFWCNVGRTINRMFIGRRITVEKWLELVNSGMTAQNLVNLKSIIFDDANLLFTCYEMISPMMKLVKLLEIHFCEDIQYGSDDDVKLDIRNLEHVKLTALHGWESIKFFADCISHCTMLSKLDINIVNKSELSIPIEFMSIFRQLQHLTIIKRGKICEYEMEFVLNNCKELKTLTVQTLAVYPFLNSFVDEVCVRNMAIRIFQRLRLSHLIFLIDSGEIKMKYLCATTSYSKSLIEYKIHNHSVLKQVVYTYSNCLQESVQ